MEYLAKLSEANLNGKLSSSAASNLELWLSEPRYSIYCERIRAMIDAGEWDKLNDAFYQIIPFGTGGRRGPVGVGPNRMNEITIAESAQGLANKVKKAVHGRRPKVVVAHDTRLTATEFTLKTACVLAGNEIDVYLFDGARATPELSFMIRHLGCDAGIVISASHNPPEDNGFKAYWNDGGQVVPPLDGELIEEVQNAQEVREIPYEEACARGFIHRLGPADDDCYFNAVLAQSLISDRSARIVYSPLHGAGKYSVYPVLLKAGFKDIHLVESQKDPDGRFPFVPDHKPNPEITSGLNAAIALGRAVKADLVIASDPDADRLACAVPSESGPDYFVLTGNQCAALLMEFICARMAETGKLKSSHRIYTTCVSSPLMPTIARSYGLTVKDDLLVGFKWIAEQIKLLTDANDFLFGSEESIGFMKGPYTRDKDAAAAALLVGELASYLKSQGKTVLGMLDDIYRKYGYFSDAGTSIFLEGAKGSQRMKNIMEKLRKNPPREIGGQPILAIVDRANGEIRNVQGNKLGSVEGPLSNLLFFRLREDNKSWIAIRPSGTEPKIKFYFSLYHEVSGNIEENKKDLDELAAKLMKSMTEVAMAVD